LAFCWCCHRLAGYLNNTPPPSDLAAQYHFGQRWRFFGWLLVVTFVSIKTTSFSWSGLLVSLGGTIVLLAFFNFFVREHIVKNTVIESQWNQVRDKIHVRWGKISEQDCDQIDGNHDRFINLIIERYGIAKKEAEDQLQGYLRAVVT